jgi:hypothetical protein
MGGQHGVRSARRATTPETEAGAWTRRDRRYRRSRVRRVVLLFILLAALATALAIPFGDNEAHAAVHAAVAQVLIVT